MKHEPEEGDYRISFILDKNYHHDGYDELESVIIGIQSMLEEEIGSGMFDFTTEQYHHQKDTDRDGKVDVYEGWEEIKIE